MEMLNAKNDYTKKGVYYLTVDNSDGRNIFLIRHRRNGVFTTVYRTLFEEKAWSHFENII